MRISVAADWVSTSFDPDVLGEPARLTCQREVFKFAAEQKRLDARNDHFYPALRTCRRRGLWWRVPASHIISFHPESLARVPSTEEGWTMMGERILLAPSVLSSGACEPPGIRLSQTE